jgi:AraC-like DNA-binding protein
MDQTIIEKLRAAIDFTERSNTVFEHYAAIIKRHNGSLKDVTTVTNILRYNEENPLNLQIGQTAKQFDINPRTLGKYFEKMTGFSTKQAFQIRRMRMAVADFARNPTDFDYSKHNYWDYSHFYKHLQQFTADHFHHFQHLHSL